MINSNSKVCQAERGIELSLKELQWCAGKLSLGFTVFANFCGINSPGWLIVSYQSDIPEYRAGKNCLQGPLGADPDMPLEDCSEGDLKSKGKIKLREPLDILRRVMHFTKMKLRLEIGHGEKTKLPKGVQWSRGGRARYAEISLYRHRRNVVPHKHSI